MTHAEASLDGRSCRSLPAGSGFLGRGGVHNIPVPAESDQPAALLEPACRQVGKLAFVSVLSLPFVTRKWDTPLHSRCQLHIRQSFGRWKIFRNQPRLRSPCETIPPSRRRGGTAVHLRPDTT